jgi:hypothetical protein
MRDNQIASRNGEERVEISCLVILLVVVALIVVFLPEVKQFVSDALSNALIQMAHELDYMG